jgi:flagellar motor switch protein FliM
MEENMNDSNLWDSIQVDMSAEFDKVKVPLGELKSIEDGLIVDLCSVYDNKVSLKVGGKLVASGSLVIINDRFGVRIEHVSESNPASTYTSQSSSSADAGEQGGADFDYSDFEVENKQG